MRAKAMGLLQYGGLDAARADELCVAILSLPSRRPTPQLFTHFMHHIGIV